MTARAAGGTVRIGVSGWRYAPWRGVFYPRGLPQHAELAFIAGRFDSVEINGTFYSLQTPQSFTRWRADAPEDFLFAVKGPRFITHLKRLRDIDVPLANFFASGVLALGPKLGPILWQFPPQTHFEPERLDAFLSLLPRDMGGAERLAARHDGRVAGRAFLRSEAQGALRHAVEVRHDSFRDARFIELLRRHGVALVCADTVSWPLLMDLTADFVYCRLHGSEELYASGYDAASLDAWAARIACWATGGEPEDAQRVLPPGRPRRGGRDVFVFFDNDMKVRAPVDAQALAERLKPAPAVRP